MTADKLNLTMLCDFYELTMANGYFQSGQVDESIAYFDMFFRKIPDGGGYAIFAGLEQVIEYLKGLNFTDEDIEYLRSKKLFNEEFLEYLANFEFKCDAEANYSKIRILELGHHIRMYLEHQHLMICIIINWETNL